jgi:hypothetical protein
VPKGPTSKIGQACSFEVSINVYREWILGLSQTLTNLNIPTGGISELGYSMAKPPDGMCCGELQLAQHEAFWVK